MVCGLPVQCKAIAFMKVNKTVVTHHVCVCVCMHVHACVQCMYVCMVRVAFTYRCVGIVRVDIYHNIAI